MVCINDGNGTRCNCINNTEHVLDLTFISSVMASSVTWEVQRNCLMGSDHFPIFIGMGIRVNKAEDIKIPRLKLHQATGRYSRE